MTLTSNNQHEILITISDASLETTDEETLTYFRIKQEFQKGYVSMVTGTNWGAPFFCLSLPTLSNMKSPLSKNLYLALFCYLVELSVVHDSPFSACLNVNKNSDVKCTNAI